MADAAPPRFRFYEEAEARKDMAEYLNEAHQLIDMKRSEVYERLQLTAPQADDQIIPRASSPTATAGDSTATPAAEFTHCPACSQGSDQGYTFAEDGTDPLVNQAVNAADAVIETLPASVYEILLEYEREGRTLVEFEAALPALMPELDETALAQIVQLALTTSYLAGMDDG